MAKGGMLSKSSELQASFDVEGESITIGIDLGDRYSYCCVLRGDGRVLTEGRVRTTADGLAKHFQDLPQTRIAMEVGTHSWWVSRALSEWGHEVIVANPRAVQLITAGNRKSDQMDAEVLARLARVDPKLLSPIQDRDSATYPDVAELNSRDLLVRTRTKLINAVRGMIKTAGFRSPSIGPESFASKASPLIPEQLRSPLMPLVQTISEVTLRIRDSDKRLERIARDRYPETLRLRQVHGAGPVTALQFVLTVGDPLRFHKSRDLGPYIGLVPKKRQSGDVDKQMRISKAGNRRLRSLLVQCSQFVLGRFGPDSDLKRWGSAIASRGGKNGKRRAIVAVARKLAVCYTGCGSLETSTTRYITPRR
ncbi:MAG TPA: IS110 family transposase [Terriglobales bacterium]|nr:IS110 family transposase [Terriglobales bacterium]